MNLQVQVKASPLQTAVHDAMSQLSFSLQSRRAVYSVNGDASGPAGQWSSGPGAASVRFGPDRRAVGVVRVTERRVNGRGSGQHVSGVGERG